MEIFGFNDYRSYLSHRLANDDEGRYRGYHKKLADAARCQSSHLSQVLASNANLTLEQAMGLASFWNMNAQELSFFCPAIRNLTVRGILT
jgi:hypothetical protein